MGSGTAVIDYFALKKAEDAAIIIESATYM